jgi:hypothetical protein
MFAGLVASRMMKASSEQRYATSTSHDMTPTSPGRSA